MRIRGGDHVADLSGDSRVPARQGSSDMPLCYALDPRNLIHARGPNLWIHCHVHSWGKNQWSNHVRPRQLSQLPESRGVDADPSIEGAACTRAELAGRSASNHPASRSRCPDSLSCPTCQQARARFPRCSACRTHLNLCGVRGLCKA